MILSINSLQVGDKVHYQPEHYGVSKYENGIIKEIRKDVQNAVWVVYNCESHWNKYQDYTSAKTNLLDIKLGWR